MRNSEGVLLPLFLIGADGPLAPPTSNLRFPANVPSVLPKPVQIVTTPAILNIISGLSNG